MSFRAKLERIDADYFIPRPADEPELDSFQAARRFIQDLSTCGTVLLCSSVAGYLFFRSGQMLALLLQFEPEANAWLGPLGNYSRTQSEGIGVSLRQAIAIRRGSHRQT